MRTPLSISTVDNPKGSIRGEKRAYTIYTNDQLPNSKDWNDVIVAYRNGAPLRVRDIGQAVSGPQDTTQAGWADGKRGIILVIFKQPGANVIDTVDKINAALPKLRATMPPAINVFTLSDRTQTIRASVADVQFTLLITILLVVMVIFVFLRSFWATIIPSVTVPLALLGACALMWPFGYSLDNLSLMALTIAVGFVVDDAIVMLENITRYVEAGETAVNAALRGSREIAFTIISISISLVAVPHSVAADGRNHRPSFSRIRRHAVDGDFGVGLRRIDADPDDGVAGAQAAEGSASWKTLCLERTCLRCAVACV